MNRVFRWTGPALVLGIAAVLGIFIALAEPVDAAPKCNCPSVVPTPEGPCVLIWCSGSNCQYRCP